MSFFVLILLIAPAIAFPTGDSSEAEKKIFEKCRPTVKKEGNPKDAYNNIQLYIADVKRSLVCMADLKCEQSLLYKAAMALEIEFYEPMTPHFFQCMISAKSHRSECAPKRTIPITFEYLKEDLTCGVKSIIQGSDCDQSDLEPYVKFAMTTLTNFDLVKDNEKTLAMFESVYNNL